MKAKKVHVLLLSAMGVWSCSDESEPTNRILTSPIQTNISVEQDRGNVDLRSFDVFQDHATASLLGLGFDVSVGFDGQLRFSPSVGSNDEWEYVLNAQITRGDQVLPMAAQSVQRTGPQLTLRNTQLEQRLRHEERGLSLEYVVANRPKGDGPLRLRYEALGHEHEVQQGVVQVRRDGKDVFRWQTFRAWDANQRELDVRVHAKGSTFWMELDDAQATYPITIDPVSTAPFWTQKGVEVGARFGFTVATADVTGDGFADVLVSQQRYSGPESMEGRVLMFPGSATGISSTAAWTFEGNQEFASLGSSLAVAGDIDGDGIEDFGVSAPYWSGADPLFETGQVYVFKGAATLGAGPDILLTGATQEANLGYSLAFGDVNCDGRPDLVSGSPNTRNGDGEVQVFVNTLGGFAAAPSFTFAGDLNLTENFGTDVSLINVNGDSDNGHACDDLVVGSPSFAGDQGRLSIFPGSTAGPGAPTTQLSGTANARMGTSVANGGDVNNDGFEDVVAGAPNFSGALTDEGGVFVFPGSGTGLQTPTILAGGQSGSRTGFSVAMADINNDGFDDVLVGANQYSNPELNEGRLVVYQGLAAGVATTPSSVFESDATNAFLGDSIASGEDLNGDGVVDVLVGGRGYPDDHQPSNPVGAVFAFAGLADCNIGGVLYPQGATNPANPCEVCDVAVSNAAWTAGNEGSSCDDGDACSTSDACVAGVCVGSAVNCDDANTCTTDLCEPSTGLCVHTPVTVNTTCDDGLFCTESDACDASGSCVGTARDCSLAAAECFDGTACDEDLDQCVPSSPSAAGTSCGGDLCMTDGMCDGNGVCSGTPVDCSSLDSACAVGVCDPADGQCFAQTFADGTGCDDDDACTTGDTCAAGVCEGQALDCSDGSDCTTDSCQNGSCVHTVAEGCFIDDTCIPAGAAAPDDACQVCDPGAATDAYSTAAAGTPCGAATCSADGTSVQTPHCNGNGECRPGTNTAQDCGAYMCADGACMTACSEDAECQTGFVCLDEVCVEETGEDVGTDAGVDAGMDAGPGEDVGNDTGADSGIAPASGGLSGSGCACSSSDAAPTDVSWLIGLFGLLAIGRRR